MRILLTIASPCDLTNTCFNSHFGVETASDELHLYEGEIMTREAGDDEARSSFWSEYLTLTRERWEAAQAIA